MAPKILVILTSHSKLGNTGKPTGWFLPELAHPYDEFVAAGCEVTVASPAGGEAPLDPGSVEAFREDASSAAFLRDRKDVYGQTAALRTLGADAAAARSTAARFDALFYPGGHGPMWDLVDDRASQRLAAAFFGAGKVVSAVCHGPAALAAVHVDDDAAKPLLVAGRRVSAFTDDEERQVQLDQVVPFLLETRLREAGAQIEKAAPWQEKVVVDGQLITGQNPASAKGVGAAIVKAVGGRVE